MLLQFLSSFHFFVNFVLFSFVFRFNVIFFQFSRFHQSEQCLCCAPNIRRWPCTIWTWKLSDISVFRLFLLRWKSFYDKKSNLLWSSILYEHFRSWTTIFHSIRRIKWETNLLWCFFIFMGKKTKNETKIDKKMRLKRVKTTITIMQQQIENNCKRARKGQWCLGELQINKEKEREKKNRMPNDSEIFICLKDTLNR